MNPADTFVARLDQVEARLEQHASRAGALVGLTDPEEHTGEQWEAGQVFAHMAEFGEYWVEQAAMVLRLYTGDPVPFGRVKTDPRRVAAIERDRAASPLALMGRCKRNLTAAREFIRSLPEAGWSARGRHPTLGQMDLTALLDEFIVTHHEQHCAQLDALRGDG